MCLYDMDEKSVSFYKSENTGPLHNSLFLFVLRALLISVPYQKLAIGAFNPAVYIAHPAVRKEFS